LERDARGNFFLKVFIFQETENRGQNTKGRLLFHLTSVICDLSSDRTSISVFPMTLMLLRSMADTATSGVSRPLMAMGILITLYPNVKIRF
jgi:hypothetical protein